MQSYFQLTLLSPSDLRKVVQISSSIGNRPSRFSTISSQFSAIYINTFHKNEVNTAILRCWTGLYLNLFKSYDTKCKYFFLDLATHEIMNARFSTISSQFSAIYIKKISQKWGSDGHFEVLNRSEPHLVQELWKKRKWGGY